MKHKRQSRNNLIIYKLIYNINITQKHINYIYQKTINIHVYRYDKGGIIFS